MMQQFKRVQKWLAMGLSVLVVLLSVAASAHSVEHVNHGLTEHCTLAFHQHQFAGGLANSTPTLPIQIQSVIISEFAITVCEVPFTASYRSRAPPQFLLS
ncbi:ABC-type zinc uptake system zinc chaperone [Shewanella sp. OPT22]|nr:ABC-type zinc uptake system zinc chaperone [Shewanella sp. OPT22]